MRIRNIFLEKIKKIRILREEATSALAGFRAGPLAWSNWNLEMLVFVEGGKTDIPKFQFDQDSGPT